VMLMLMLMLMLILFPMTIANDNTSQMVSN
jgi:hypothetical protein